MRTISHASRVRNILSTLRAASPQEAASGAAWYDTAHTWIAREASARGLSVDTVAGVVAALSPNVSWEHNLAAAKRVLDGTPARYRGYGANLAKAERIVRGEDPRIVLGGFKVRSFYRLLVDPTRDYDVVVDAHAAHVSEGRLAGSHEQSHARLDTYRQYNDTARAYREAAAWVNLRPTQAQAIAWLVQKRRWEAESNRAAALAAARARDGE